MTLPLFQPLDEWRLWSPAPMVATFRAEWAATLDLLDREIDAVAATNPVLRVVTDASEIRRDGMLRANARVHHRGVVLEFTHPAAGQLTYSCARFESYWAHDGPAWQQNVRAIALGLEALRKVDRYGISDRGQQYAGFRAIGAGDPGTSSAGMSRSEAIRLLATASYTPVGDNHEPSAKDVRFMYRLAAARHHPDRGGNRALFGCLTEARDLLAGEAS